MRKTGYFDPKAVHPWRREFSRLRQGGPQRFVIDLGATMAVLLTIIILLFTLFQFRVAEKRVHYG